MAWFHRSYWLSPSEQARYPIMCSPVSTAWAVLALIVAAGLPPAEAADLAAEADTAYKNHQFDIAVTKYSAAIKQKPTEAILYNSRALAYAALKQYERSLADFSKALKLKPDWYVYYNRGTAYDAQGNSKAAIGDFTKAIQLSPPGTIGRVDSLVARAHSYFDQENADPALADLNAAIKIGVKEADPYVLRGVLYKITHRYDKSLADYEKAISLDPKFVRAYRAEAFLLSVCPVPKYRNAKKAISYATKACELTDWKSADELETLASAYAEAGDFDQAVKWQMRAVEIDPKAVSYGALSAYKSKEPIRDLNRKEKPFASLAHIGESVRIGFGERVAVRFEQGTGGTLHLLPGKTGDEKKPNSLTINYHQEKPGRVLLLSHTLPGPLTARCLARLKDYDTYFETDILPVPNDRVNREIWTEPIEELVLFDFHLGDEHKSETKQLSKTSLNRRKFFVFDQPRSAVMFPHTLEDPK